MSAPRVRRTCATSSASCPCSLPRVSSCRPRVRFDAPLSSEVYRITAFARVPPLKHLVASAVLIPLLGWLAGATNVGAQVVGSEKPEPPPGYPITSEAIIRNCSACHSRDSTGRMGRISYLRKTPEGWQTSIRRMASLNGVPIDAATAREVVRYLSDHQGLAPEEADP